MQMLILLLFALCMFSFNFPSSQGKRFAKGSDSSFDLWPEGIPNRLFPNEQNETTDRGGRVHRLHVPRLEYFAPKNNAPGSKPTGIGIISIPGGGYGSLSVIMEGTRIADWLTGHGVTVFVLRYRCLPYLFPVPLQDGLRAIRFVRSKASQFSVDPDRIGVIGFSAGGHLAAMLSTLYLHSHYDLWGRSPNPNFDNISARPNFAILLYPITSMEPNITHIESRDRLIGSSPNATLTFDTSAQYKVTTSTPPTLLIHATTDQLVKVDNSIVYYQALRQVGVDVELTIFHRGGHAFVWQRNAPPWEDVILKRLGV